MHGYNQSEGDKLLNVSLPQLLTHCLVCLMHKKSQLEMVEGICENIHIILARMWSSAKQPRWIGHKAVLPAESFPIYTLSLGISV